MYEKIQIFNNKKFTKYFIDEINDMQREVFDGEGYDYDRTT
jgi:hypothetical protein